MNTKNETLSLFNELIKKCKSITENGIDLITREDLYRLYKNVDHFDELGIRSMLIMQLATTLEHNKSYFETRNVTDFSMSEPEFPLRKIAPAISKQSVELIDDLVYLLGNDPEPTANSNFRMLQLLQIILLIDKNSENFKTI
jgi:hypothetical protein